MPYNDEKMNLACKSKYNFKREDQVSLLMIADGKKWRYLAVKNFSRLLRGITSNQEGDFHCLIFFHSYGTERKLKKHEKICNDHDYCYVEFNKISKNHHG